MNTGADLPPSAPVATGRRVLVAHRPAYLPWQGYVARLLDVDTFVVLDHVPYTQGGWQNRTWIRGHHGDRLLLGVPVRTAGRSRQRLCDVAIADSGWAAIHWRTLTQVYGKAPFFERYEERLRIVYSRQWDLLADVVVALLEVLLDAAGLTVTLVRSSTLRLREQRTGMLIELCGRERARVLRVGTGAAIYLDQAALAVHGIVLQTAGYTNPPYPRGRDPFYPALSLLDALMFRGPATRRLLESGSTLASVAPRP